MNKVDELVKEINNTLSEWDNDDEFIDKLEKAMVYFCSNYDISEGFKHAISLTLDDQFNNHKSELEVKDLQKLLDILTK